MGFEGGRQILSPPHMSAHLMHPNGPARPFMVDLSGLWWGLPQSNDLCCGTHALQQETVGTALCSAATAGPRSEAFTPPTLAQPLDRHPASSHLFLGCGWVQQLPLAMPLHPSK